MTKSAQPPARAPLQLFAGTASQVLGRKIARHYGQPLAPLKVRQFSDGEWYPQLGDQVQNAHVCLIQATYPPAGHVLELLLTIDAAKQAGACYVTVVAPYLGYMRQDKVHHTGGPIGARLQAHLLAAAGADRLIVCDVHTLDSLAFFDFPVQHVATTSLFVPYIQQLQLPSLTLVAPDAGAVTRVRAYAQHFGRPMVIGRKHRPHPGQAATVQLDGNVRGTNAVIIDDMVDTGETICQTAAQLHAQGARTVHAFCTHPILSGDAQRRLAAAPLAKLFVTDTIPLQSTSALLEICSVAPLIANALCPEQRPPKPRASCAACPAQGYHSAAAL